MEKWYIQKPGDDDRSQGSNYSAILSSWEPSQEGQGNILYGGTKIDIIVRKTGVATLQAAADQQIRAEDSDADGPTTILSKEIWSLVGGLPVVRWEVQRLGLAPGIGVITVMGEYTILVGGEGDVDLIDAIICTMRPL